MTTNTTHTNGSTEPSEKLKAIPSIADLDLRDYFAAKAMQGLMADPNTALDADAIAAVCYRIADGMLAERNKQ